MQIIHTNDINTARKLASEEGYEPVECSFGHFGSVVGFLTMDHHGEHSHLDGVALRAYRDHFGARRDNPRFVVTGAADADACFCIAALAGILPHPSRAGEFDKAPPPVQKAMTADLTELATLINQVDVAPIGVRLEETDIGTLILLWNQLSGSGQDALEFYAGVARWRSLLTRQPQALLKAARDEKAERVGKAKQAKVLARFVGVRVLESEVWGFDVWYAQYPGEAIMVRTPRGNVTVGYESVEMAEKKLDVGGLKNVWEELEPAGWGGREAIGGSPRGVVLSREEVIKAGGDLSFCITGPFTWS